MTLFGTQSPGKLLRRAAAEAPDLDLCTSAAGQVAEPAVRSMSRRPPGRSISRDAEPHESGACPRVHLAVPDHDVVELDGRVLDDETDPQ
jgi:hypothetical protein